MTGPGTTLTREGAWWILRIVIIGAGAVGSYLAQRLAAEGQDVIVVESDPQRAAHVQAEIDCLVVAGNGASPSVLEGAGLRDADLLIAVTSSDAVNILACHAGGRMHVPTRIARVEDPMLRDEAETLGVDLLIDPGEATARELMLMIGQRGISEKIEFAGGRLDLIGGYIASDAPVAGMALSHLRDMVTGWTWVVVAVIRHGETIIARGSTEIEPGDHVLIMAETAKVDEAFRLLGWKQEQARKVIVLGGTRLAMLAALHAVESGLHTILIDDDESRVRAIAEKDDRIVCVVADPTDSKVLEAEGVASADAVLALSGWDEVNLLGCLIARALGAGKTIARFARTDLVKTLAGVGIDAGVSSRLSAASAILRFVRRGQIHSVVTFRDSDAEAIELQVGGRSPAIGLSLADLGLPHSMIVGGVIRGDDAFVPRGDTVVQRGDRLIVIADPAAIPQVEKLSG